ncbi:hypothetical protein AVEN_244678-1 [Araneus ventricosus]|uniref:Uncharacterized protein n=1 Tax=Araneus ventricosus TaxID=182803 RepID=A0A4Y2KGM9_ARAVE|nr:hypothetical protein AVEN_244678-1 [Araneus ventricosus]
MDYSDENYTDDDIDTDLEIEKIPNEGASSSVAAKHTACTGETGNPSDFSVDRNADQLEPTRFENYNLADAADKKEERLIYSQHKENKVAVIKPPKMPPIMLKRIAEYPTLLKRINTIF